MKKRIAHSIFNSKNGIQWSSSILQTIIKMGRCIKKISNLGGKILSTLLFTENHLGNAT